MPGSDSMPVSAVSCLLMATVLMGCAESRLVVRGNMPGTYWIAQNAAQLHASLFCDRPLTFEDRAVSVDKNNKEAQVVLKHRCVK